MMLSMNLSLRLVEKVNELGGTMSRILRNKFNSWNLNKKINTVVTGLNCCVSIILLVVFTSFYVSSYISQADNLMRNQLSTMAESYGYMLNSYDGLAETLVIDSSVQAYLSQEKSNYNDFVLLNNARNTLQNAINMYPGMDYISIMDTDFGGTIFKGNISRIASGFADVCRADYAKSLSCSGGPLRMSYNDAYLGRGGKTLNMYLPVYSTSVIHQQIGLLCIIFDGSLFHIPAVSDADTLSSQGQVMLLDSTRTIISSTQDSLVGTPFEYTASLNNISGDFGAGASLYNYRKIDQSNFYLVSKIPLVKMYQNCIIVLLLLTVILVAVTYFGLAICKRVINRNYVPLDRVVHAMNSVGEGKLDVRIEMKNVGSDFAKLTNGFNFMMDETNALMKQVKAEQQQMDQIRFNALQSQIQPHFLYNALDSIHWKAISDGNYELSEFVKALAKYYRICLSKGKDIIPLEQEIEHVKNYLIIQNMRYDKVIYSRFEIAEDCRNAMMPKITLQPLVENSIYHGIRVKDGESGEITITACREENNVLVTVADNGSGMTEEEIEEMNRSIQKTGSESGYGIRNVNRRLKLLFGEEYGLYYSANKSGGITVTVRLPGDRDFTQEEIL